MSSVGNKKNAWKLIGSATLLTLSLGMALGATLAWHMAQSKASISANNGVIRNTTAMTLGLRYFTGNGTLGSTYEGYDSTMVSGATINYTTTSGYYFAPLDTETKVTQAFDFSAMRPGKRYSFAFEETGKNALSILLAAFAAPSQASAPYKEMYTGPLAIANDVMMNQGSWLRIHDISRDNVASSSSVYHYLGSDRLRGDSAAAIGNQGTGSGTRQIGSITKTSGSGNVAYDFVLFGDMTIGVYDGSQTTYVASTTAASTYKLYGYSNPQNMKTSSGADEATSSFYYVNDATIAAWNTGGSHTKYISSAGAVVGFSQGFSLDNTASVNDGHAGDYIADTVDDGALKDKIDYRFSADIQDGLASGNTAAVSGESASEYQLGTSAGDNLGDSQLVFITISFSDDDSDRLKPICKRGTGDSEIIYYAYHPQGTFEPYYGLDAGLGNITLE